MNDKTVIRKHFVIVLVEMGGALLRPILFV